MQRRPIAQKYRQGKVKSTLQAFVQSYIYFLYMCFQHTLLQREWKESEIAQYFYYYYTFAKYKPTDVSQIHRSIAIYSYIFMIILWFICGVSTLQVSTYLILWILYIKIALWDCSYIYYNVYWLSNPSWNTDQGVQLIYESFDISYIYHSTQRK